MDVPIYPLTHIKSLISSSYLVPFFVPDTTDIMFLQRFIRNDATRTDPPEIYNLRTVLISLVVGDGHAFLNPERNINIDRHVEVRYSLVWTWV